jgi:formylglycine-generating enzyme required for sulfatase activity
MNEELNQAIEKIRRRPTGQSWFLPVLLSDCKIPDRNIGAGETLHSFQWVALHREWDNGIRSILDVIQPSLPFEPEMIRIPAGQFLLGSDPKKDAMAGLGEQPQHIIYLPDYSLAKTPITNAEYRAFVEATDHSEPSYWTNKKPPEGKETHPVVLVSWEDAYAYCYWLSSVTGKSYLLPSEAEWEKGARGNDARIFPWGDHWDEGLCNTKELGLSDTTPVGAYPNGASPWGLLDIAGNVWEWTRSLWGDYPYPTDKKGMMQRENLIVPGNPDRVLRGGSFLYDVKFARCAFRYWYPARQRYWNLGFRVALPPNYDL